MIKSFIKTLIATLLGCVLIVMVTPLIRREIVLIQLAEAKTEIECGNFAEAESRLVRYETWALYHPAIHQKILSRLIESEVRLGKVGSAKKVADIVHHGYNHSLHDVRNSSRTILHDGPDSIVNSAYAAFSPASQAWDPDIGRVILLDELWKLEQYEQLTTIAKKILEDDPADKAAKDKLAMVENRQRTPTVIERHSTATTIPPRPPASHQATIPAVTVVNPVEVTPEPAGTFEEVAATEDSPDQKAKSLRVRKAELTARIQSRRKTLTDNRPATEAQRSKDAAQRRYDALQDKAMKLEEAMNNSTGQKRGDVLEEMRGMKGQMTRCQQELEKAEEAAKAAKGRLTAAIENDPEIKAIEKDLAEVLNELKSL